MNIVSQKKNYTSEMHAQKLFPSATGRKLVETTSGSAAQHDFMTITHDAPISPYNLHSTIHSKERLGLNTTMSLEGDRPIPRTTAASSVGVSARGPAEQAKMGSNRYSNILSHFKMGDNSTMLSARKQAKTSMNTQSCSGGLTAVTAGGSLRRENRMFAPQGSADPP